MKLSKTLGPVLIAGSALLLSACADEEPLVRDTSAKPMSVFQGLSVTEEIGGLTTNDHLLVNLVDLGSGSITLSGTSSCQSGGNHSALPSAVAGYDSQVIFSACKVEGLTFNGSIELSQDDTKRHVQFNNLAVDTTYNGGALHLVISGALARDCVPDCNKDSKSDVLEISQLILDGAVTQYGRTVPIKLQIRDYRREAITSDDEEGNDTQSLSVRGRITKTGDYGTYDIDISTLDTALVGGASNQASGHGVLFEGSYTGNNYTKGKLYIADRLKAGSYLAIEPFVENVNNEQMFTFTGKIDSIDYESQLYWTSFIPPDLVDIFDLTPDP
ncbi:MAG: hypothetical protein REI12_02360 [Pedobacter sp.]|nr:hypothetical protein [Pedobacter sp.]